MDDRLAPISRPHGRMRWPHSCNRLTTTLRMRRRRWWNSPTGRNWNSRCIGKTNITSFGEAIFVSITWSANLKRKRCWAKGTDDARVARSRNDTARHRALSRRTPRAGRRHPAAEFTLADSRRRPQKIARASHRARGSPREISPRAHAGRNGDHASGHVRIVTRVESRRIYRSARSFRLAHGFRENSPLHRSAPVRQSALAAPGETHPLLANLGPEPLSDEFNGDHLWRKSRGRS